MHGVVNRARTDDKHAEPNVKTGQKSTSLLSSSPPRRHCHHHYHHHGYHDAAAPMIAQKEHYTTQMMGSTDHNEAANVSDRCYNKYQDRVACAAPPRKQRNGQAQSIIDLP